MNRNVEEKLSQVEKKKNNFEDYGFSGDFEGEILKEFDKYFIGYIYDFGIVRPAKWFKKNGSCETRSAYDITPIKKKWYEIEENFPCLVVAESGDYKDTFVAIKFNKGADTLNYSDIGWDSKFCRPATNEEIEALKVKQ